MDSGRSRVAPPAEPFVSVVIPTCNRAASLRRLLRALQEGSVPAGGMEVIVVDDGSSDGTAAVAAEAEVRYIFQRNAGPAAARERGWRSSVGNVVVFMDDDVIPAPDAVVRLASATASADGVGALILPVDTGSLVAHYMHVDGLVNHRVIDDKVHWLITAAAAFRRDALERAGGFDLDFPRAAGEDVDLSLRLLAEKCELKVEPSAVVQHDHRSRFTDLLRTCHRYGSAYGLLASRHDAHRVDRRRSALLRLSPIEWVRVYRGYRGQASIGRSLVFAVLHAVVVIPYALGILSGPKHAGSGAPAQDVELLGRPHGHQAPASEQAELVGFARSDPAA